MRRIAILTAFAVLAMPSAAGAVTNTVAYHARIAMAAPPAPGSPAKLGYIALQHIGTDPDGSQPDTTPSFTWYFAKEIESHAQGFPTCPQSAIDGQATVPAACGGAAVGTGQAIAYAGTPGTPLANSVREDMSVTLVNGTPAGQQWLLYLASVPGAPVYLRRTIPGTVVPATDPYGFGVRFDVPADLQNQLGLQITLAHLVVNVKQNLGFLTITSCTGSIPYKDLVTFNGPAPIEVQGSAPCEVGPGFADYPTYVPFPSYPPYPPYPPAGGGGGGGGGGGETPGSSGGTPAGTGSSGGGTPPPPPAPPRITGKSRTKTALVRADGSFILPGVIVACPADSPGPCTVDGTAVGNPGAAKGAKRVVLAKTKFRLAPGRSSAVKMRLTKAGKKALKRKKLLKLTIKLRIRKASGLSLTRTFKTNVKAKKHARRR